MAKSRLLALLALAGCGNPYWSDGKDMNLEAPVDLKRRLADFRSGIEKWHGDPRAVADQAIRDHLDVPWKADPFRPGLYEVLYKPEWGTYVVRRYRYPSGNTMNYRVKVRKYEEIWYPLQVSRYKFIPDVPDDGMHVHQH